MSDRRNTIQYRASQDGELKSAMAALENLHDSVKPDKEKKPVKRKVKRKRKRKKAAGGVEEEEFEYDWPKCVCGMHHPPVPFFLPPDGKKCTYYWQIADMFPFMTLHRVLTTEIKFIQADKDQSGVIEFEELEELLLGIMGEPMSESMAKRTFRQIDTDDSNTLDFTEVLTVVDGIIQRRTVNLPNPVKNEVSKTCSIQ